MKQYLEADPWKIIEKGFHPEHNKVTESIFSIGNGRFGQRGMFEEHFSGKTLQGSYFAGIYYPDKTRVGWWKNGYPEYFAKVLNSVNWIGVDIYMNEERLDLNTMPPSDFMRELDMQHGILSRSFTVTTSSGNIGFKFERFCSMADTEVGAMRISMTSHGFAGRVRLQSVLDWQIENEDANWEESFWIHRASEATTAYSRGMAETKKTGFIVSSATTWNFSGVELLEAHHETKEMFCAHTLSFEMSGGDEIHFDKFSGHQSTFYHDKSTIYDGSLEVARRAADKGFEQLREAHSASWLNRWRDADIEIEGDTSAQQGIRFNIFHLLSTYTGDDARLNIGPKGFTGEKYGGSTYWDTEAYCIPFYLGSGDHSVPRQLLVYRYRHLQKAIENAEKLGFTNGAALYPMVTMNGEECHNEWEITFEEIHRNGAIAYAIYDYIKYTGDSGYLLEGGLEVLIGIARFWAQRFNWSEARSKYVMLGVTGPNEYENNVDNNWYTSYIARWCLQYAKQCIDSTAKDNHAILSKTGLIDHEIENWNTIAANVHLPYDQAHDIFLQQENFMDKEQLTVDQIPEGQRPINQNWSWDRILRSCFIKQADVLQGMFFFEEDFDIATLKRNFDFYEPRTVHESSLSPCVHSILASRLGLHDKAYEMYLRTARLDLEDYNNDTDEGLHITSMAGTWMSIVKGFGGVRVLDDKLSLAPSIPHQWTALRFHLYFRENVLLSEIAGDMIKVTNLKGPRVSLNVYNMAHTVEQGASLELDLVSE